MCCLFAPSLEQQRVKGAWSFASGFTGTYGLLSYLHFINIKSKISLVDRGVTSGWMGEWNDKQINMYILDGILERSQHFQ